ncbi:glycosyltransferase [Candidatus Gracilibacteria bacterium]|nr:glycosyltransferase [Candidatus Gracilibacteria bacterium]
MKTILVSIILPTYNGNHNWLSIAIDSVLNQTFNNFELIIINDASTNNIEKTILEYKKKDNRIIYIKNEQNLRLTKTLNKGIDLSKGKYIARIDDDDIWCDNNKLQKQVDFMNKNPDYGLCGTSSIFIDMNGKEISNFISIESDKKIRKKILNGNQFLHSNIIFRKNIIFSIGKYIDNNNTKYCEDYEFWLRIGTKYKINNLNNIFTKIRISENGISISNKFKQTYNAFRLAIKYNEYYNGKLFYLIWIYRLSIITISYLLKKIGIYNNISYFWRKYFLKQKI